MEKELICHGRDKKRETGKPIVCSRCGVPGGTLVKIDDHYEHQDRRTCLLLQSRRKS